MTNDNTVSIAQANNLTNAHAFGLTVTNTVTSGTAVSVQTVGQTLYMPVEAGLSLAAGDVLYLSAITAGKATNIPPGYPVVVGVVLDASTYSLTNLYITAQLSFSPVLNIAGTGGSGLLTMYGASNSLASTNGSVVGESVTISGRTAPDDGGGGEFYWTDDTVMLGDGGVVVVPAGPRIGCWKRIIPDGATLNAKWFGAKGNLLDDDTAAIQAALDCAMRRPLVAALPDVSGPFARVLLPDGQYIISDTLHIGYGCPATGYCELVLEGTGWQDYDTLAPTTIWSAGTTLVWNGTYDRMAVNIQGTRNSGIRNLSILNNDPLCENQTPVLPEEPAPPFYLYTRINTIAANQVHLKPDITNWMPQNAVTYQTAPFCGVCVDGYSNDLVLGPPADKYPVVTYPAWAGSTGQYGKLNSGSFIVENCNIRGFWIGICGPPNNSGNADFGKLCRTQVHYCTYGVRLSHFNARLNDLTDCSLGINYIGYTNKPVGTNPGPNSAGNSQNLISNIDFGYAYQAFDVDTNGPLVCNNCYAEHLTWIGQCGGSADVAIAASFTGCSFSFDRATNPGAGKPYTSYIVPLHLIQNGGRYQNCVFDNVWGIELFDAAFGGSPMARSTFKECLINNHFAAGTFPAADASAKCLTHTGGVVLLPAIGTERGPRRFDNCKFTFQSAGAQTNSGDSTVITVTGGALTSTVYDGGIFWGNMYYDYIAAEADMSVSINLSSFKDATTGLATITSTSVTATYGAWPTAIPREGDVILPEVGTGYVIVVTDVDTLNSEITAQICNGYVIDTAGVVTLLGANTIADGGFVMLRAGARQQTQQTGLSISLTATSPVGTLKDITGAPVANASNYYSVGDSLLIAPVVVNPIVGAKLPFQGFPTLIAVDNPGATITFDANSALTIELPCTAIPVKQFIY